MELTLKRLGEEHLLDALTHWLSQHKPFAYLCKCVFCYFRLHFGVSSPGMANQEKSVQSSYSSNEPLLRQRGSVSCVDDVRKIHTGLECPVQEKKFFSLEEILVSFGRWHPFFRRKVFVSSVVVFLLSLSIPTLQIASEVLTKDVEKNNSYCPCVWDNHKPQQEVLLESFPYLRDLGNSNPFGTSIGLIIFFISNRTGRRFLIGGCLVLNGAFLMAAYYFSKYIETQTRLAALFVTAMAIAGELTGTMNTLEWVPSSVRPIALFCMHISFFLAQMLSSFAFRYMGQYAIHLLLVWTGLLVCGGVYVMLFMRDSPYYHLTRQSIDQLHFSILRIAKLKKEKTETEALDRLVDDAIDDVAFDVFEGNDSVADAALRAFSCWRLVKVFMAVTIINISLTALKISAPSSSGDFFRWGVFERHAQNSGIQMAGLLLGLVLLKFERRRPLLICLVFIISGVISTTMFVLPLERTYDHCTRTFVARDALGIFHLVLSMLNEVVRRSGDLFIFLFSVEYYPTAIRPACLAVQLGLVHGFSLGYSIVIDGLMSSLTYELHAIVVCLLMSGLALLLPRRPFPINEWYADLDVDRKHKLREAYPKPFLSTKAKILENFVSGVEE